MGSLPLVNRAVRRAAQSTWYFLASGLFRLTGRSGAKRVIIHVGLHKTATLAFQEELKRNQAPLQIQGIRFNWSESRKLAMKLRKNSPLPDADLQQSRNMMQAIISQSPEPIIVFSKEAFAGDPHRAYENLTQVAADLKRILEPWPICILIGVRRQDTFVESLYSQYIKSGGTQPFDEYRRVLDDRKLDWLRIVVELERVFQPGSVHVRVFDDFPRDSDALAKHMLGALVPDLWLRRTRKKQANLGYSRSTLEVARCANQWLDPRERKSLRRFLETRFPRRSGESLSLYSEEQRSALLAYYEPSNEQLFCRYLGRSLPKTWRPAPSIECLLHAHLDGGEGRAIAGS